MIPDSLLRGALRRDDRPLPRARRLRPGDDGHDPERRPHGAEGRGVRLARQDVRDRRRRARSASSTQRRRRAARARGSSRATSGARARRRTRRSRTGSGSRWARARATGAPAVFWLDETRAHDARAAREGRAYLRRARHRRPRDRDPARRRGDALHARARPRGAGHDLGDRQRPARLPHGPLPDPRARHEREDALDRAAHGGRRAVRDRRRRLGAEARAAVRAARTTCAGTRSASSSRWRPRSSTWPTRPATRGAGRSADALDGRPASSSRTTGRRRARSASSTTAAATSTSRCTGRRSSPPRRRTRSWPRASRRSREQLAEEEAKIIAELDGVQGEPVDLGGYYRPDPEKADGGMRPSATLNAIVASIS